jgi:NADPH-dependent 2,4-dienoyl-CoA reductase/sulfur reductase-like enzyme
MRTLEETSPASAVIVGGGYIGLEMADALTTRGIAVTQMEQLPEVLPTVDPDLGRLVHAELAGHGVEVLPGTPRHHGRPCTGRKQRPAARRCPGGGERGDPRC